MKNVTEIMQELITLTKEKLPQITNFRVGGVFRSLLEIIAYCIEKIYIDLDNILKNRYVQNAEGMYLDYKAQELDLVRSPAQKTEGYVIFTRDESNNFDIVIPKDTVIATKYGIKFFTTHDEVLSAGNIEKSILVNAEFEGEEYNLSGGQVEEILMPIFGIVAVRNDENWIVTWGKDSEDDDSLRERCLLQWTSRNGANKDAYISWAKSIQGVDHVVIVPHTRGLGSLDLIITGVNNALAHEELLTKVQEVIEERRPIGTDILVRNPSEIVVDLAVNVKFSEAESYQKEEIEQVIMKYFLDLNIGQNVEPSALIWKIFSLDKVKSVEIPQSRINISTIQIARLGDLNLTLEFEGDNDGL